MSPERPMFRNASKPAERPLASRSVDVENASAAIRATMHDGGSCTVESNGRRLVLVHDPAVDAPLRGWPWPFTLFAPHRVRLLTYEGTMRTSSLTYEKSRIEEAIQYFLSGLPPKAKVAITRERASGRRA